MKMVLIVVFLLPSIALACGPKDAQVFSCTTGKEKVVEVCQTPSAISYTYGKKGHKPEMSLVEPNASFRWEHSAGTKVGVMDDLLFPNGSTTYVISHVADFDSGELIEARITAMQPGKHPWDQIVIHCKNATVRFNAKAIKSKAQEP